MHDCSTDCALHRAVEARQAPAGSSRREFVSGAVLASVGAFLAACGDSNIAGVQSGGFVAPPPMGGLLTVVLFNFPALNANGGIARVDGGTSTPIAVTRVSAIEYLAFSMICPHARFRPIEIVAGGFECPNHGAQFHPDGSWRGGQNAPPLRQYFVEFVPGTGSIRIS